MDTGIDLGKTPAVTYICASATPHATYFVPDTFASMRLKSPDGGYYYHADENHGCTYWLADITLGTKSNSNPNSQGMPAGPRKVVIKPDSYDLPSSSKYGYTIPIVKEDSGRYILSVQIYKKAFGETQFELFQSGEWQGVWTGSKCSMNHTQGTLTIYPPAILVKDPDVGVDIYRVAVRVILRGTAQRVQVFIDQPLPE